MKKRWTTEEDRALRDMYHKGEQQHMETYFKRTWVSIRVHARKLGLSRWTGFNRESDLTVMLSGSNESMYWLGFLLADGYFSVGSRVKPTLATLDQPHLERFAEFIHVSHLQEAASGKNVTVSAQDKEIVPQLVKRYRISNQKTYFPPDITQYNLTTDQLISMIIGFFDGDGNIQKRVYHSFLGRLKCHSSWLSNVLFMKETICKKFGVSSIQEPKINKQGYAEWFLTAEMLRAMKMEAEHLSLPILERKWGNVVPAKDRVLDDKMTAYVRNSSKKTSELSRELGIKYTTVYQARYRHLTSALT